MFNLFVLHTVALWRVHGPGAHGGWRPDLLHLRYARGLVDVRYRRWL